MKTTPDHSAEAKHPEQTESVINTGKNAVPYQTEKCRSRQKKYKYVIVIVKKMFYTVCTVCEL